MKRHLTITFIITLIIAVLFGAWCLKFRSSRRQLDSAVVSPLNHINTSLPRHKDFNVTVHFFGKAQANEKVIITALEAGTIASVDVTDESVVKKSTLLFTLAGARINASAATIRQKIESLKQQVAIAKSTVSRKQKAVEQKIASFDELDKAKTASALLNAQLTQASQQLQLLDDAIHIRAPFNGIFTHRKVSEGQAIEKGTVLGEVIVPANIRVVATLFPTEDTSLQGRTATIHTTNAQALSGIVTRVLPRRTVAGGLVVWIEGNDINQNLKPGETVGGNILLATHEKVLALPEKAVVRDEQEKTYVFIKHAQGYTKQQVQTGPSSNGWVEILSGLTEADEVVTDGAYELFYRDFNKVYKVAD